MKASWKILGVLSLLIVSVHLTWMHRYQYEHVGTALVRINRFTGQGCYFVEGEWDSRSMGEPLPKDSGNKDASILFGLTSKQNLCE